MTVGILSTVFTYTLFCAFISCFYRYKIPEVSINDSFYTERQTFYGQKILQNPYPVVYTKSGGIKGYSMASMSSLRIHAFEGIPYGRAPIKNLRFRSPEPAYPWHNKIKTAFSPLSKCLQFHPVAAFRVIGSEDCLNLNIYSPNVPEESENRNSKEMKKVPVIVFFHGGSNIFGSGDELGPAYLVDKGVILVTVNFRLGALGFLSTGDLASPGNYGLKDQALALKWIHENIEAFGGDSQKVTIMGQSAGAVNVHLHMISNKTRGYFRSAVALSGNAFNHWGVISDKKAKFYTQWLANIFSCPSLKHNSTALVECLRSKNPNFLTSNSIYLFKWLITPPVIFAPVVEPDGPNAFLTDRPENIYKRGEVAKYPFITTTTEREGFLLQEKYLRRNLDKYQSYLLNYDDILSKDEINVINQRIQKFYFESESPETVPLEALSDIISDRYFTSGLIKTIKAHAQIAPTWAYIFAYNGSHNIAEVAGFPKSDWLVGHFQDVLYFFNSSTYYDGIRKNTQDYKISTLLTSLIANFAKSGEPIYENKNGEKIKLWNQVYMNEMKSESEIQFLRIDNDEAKMVANPFVKRTSFWSSLNLSDT